MKTFLLCASALLLLSLSGCGYYTAIAVDNDKAYVTGHQFFSKQVYVCNIAQDGSLSNCQDAK